MPDEPWMVFWTGSGAVVGFRTYGLYFTVQNGDPFQLKLERAWALSGVAGQKIEATKIPTVWIKRAQRACSYRLSACGAPGNRRITDFPPVPVYYEPEEVRRYFPEDPVAICYWLKAQVASQHPTPQS